MILWVVAVFQLRDERLHILQPEFARVQTLVFEGFAQTVGLDAALHGGGARQAVDAELVADDDAFRQHGRRVGARPAHHDATAAVFGESLPDRTDGRGGCGGGARLAGGEDVRVGRGEGLGDDAPVHEAVEVGQVPGIHEGMEHAPIGGFPGDEQELGGRGVVRHDGVPARRRSGWIERSLPCAGRSKIQGTKTPRKEKGPGSKPEN